MLPLLAFFLCFAPLSAQAQEGVEAEDENAIRGFIWGLPADIIKENEKGNFAGEEVKGDGRTILFFLDKIRGLRTSIGYELQDNKLWRVRIFVEEKYFEQQDALDDLLVIHTDLTRRFGKPVDEKMIWRDTREKNKPGSWGWAVFRSELIMRSIWQAGDTSVETYLGAPTKYKTILSVTYEHLPTKLKQQELREEKQIKESFSILP